MAAANELETADGRWAERVRRAQELNLDWDDERDDDAPAVRHLQAVS